MNYGQLVTAVLNRVNGGDSGDGVLSSTVVKSFISEALNAVESEREWDWLDYTTTFTTTAGTDTYADPVDLGKVRHLRVSTEAEHLQPVSLEEADEYLTNGGSGGMPEVWAHDSGFLILRPVPDATYTIQHRYLKTETALSGDTDTPLMPARFHWAIVEYACSLAHDLVGQQRLAETAMARYERWLVRMADDSKRSGRPGRILVREPGGY